MPNRVASEGDDAPLPHAEKVSVKMTGADGLR